MSALGNHSSSNYSICQNCANHVRILSNLAESVLLQVVETSTLIDKKQFARDLADASRSLKQGLQQTVGCVITRAGLLWLRTRLVEMLYCSGVLFFWFYICLSLDGLFPEGIVFVRACTQYLSSKNRA